MPCSQTLSGITRDCSPSLGGIVEVYIANFADVTAKTVTTDKITAITMAASAKFHKYEFRRNTGSLSSNYQITAESGSSFVQSDLVLVFSRMETSKRVEMSALAQGDLVAIVKDSNGAYWFLGFNEPLVASAGDGLTGTQRSDRNGYSITLTDVSAELPYEVLVGTGGVDLSEIVT
jgi:hypothetical protein